MELSLRAIIVFLAQACILGPINPGKWPLKAICLVLALGMVYVLKFGKLLSNSEFNCY